MRHIKQRIPIYKVTIITFQGESIDFHKEFLLVLWRLQLLLFTQHYSIFV